MDIMANKTRFIIHPDREYIVKLSDGDEVTVTGKQIVQLGYHVVKMDEIIRCFQKMDETGEGWF